MCIPFPDCLLRQSIWHWFYICYCLMHCGVGRYADFNVWDESPSLTNRGIKLVVYRPNTYRVKSVSSLGSLNVFHTSTGTSTKAFLNLSGAFNFFSADGSTPSTTRIQIFLIHPGYRRYLNQSIHKYHYIVPYASGSV
jgi:hypothetical protein